MGGSGGSGSGVKWCTVVVVVVCGGDIVYKDGLGSRLCQLSQVSCIHVIKM
jgi:hypothetical protein